jgi:hypothetical protein
MLKSFAALLGVAAAVLSLNLPANEPAPGLALAQMRSGLQPVAAHLEATTGLELGGSESLDASTQSPNSADGGPNAWLCALGFLGLVVLRRTRSDPMT